MRFFNILLLGLSFFLAGQTHAASMTVVVNKIILMIIRRRMGIVSGMRGAGRHRI